LNTNIKAVFFDIGGTLVEKTKNKERDTASITEIGTRYRIYHGNDPAA